MRRPRRVRENLEEMLEDIKPKLGVAAYARPLYYDVFQTVKSYLLKLYLGDKVTPPAEELPFKVVEAFSYVPPGILTIPMIIGFDPLDNYTSSEQSFLAVVKYNNNRYYISLSIVKDYSDQYIMFVVGENPEELYTIELTNLLIKLAIRNSGYYGKFLKFSQPSETVEKVKFKILPPPNLTLSDIYLKDKSDLEDFVEAVKRKNQGLRYLFVGEPGTGKTDTVRAIIAECLKVDGITVIEVDAGSGISLNVVFEYAEIFSPVLLCIDDIDILVGSRENYFRAKELSSALQALDGFVEKDDHYLIATTNDRKLVDFALRRPGRFDLIIEFKELDPEFYPDLVLRESKDEKLAEVFKDERIRRKLYNLKVTGAFIVTLVKHLLKPRYDETRYNPETVIALIDKLHTSFKQEVKKEEKIGFVGGNNE
jgi:cell division protease FtsH